MAVERRARRWCDGQLPSDCDLGLLWTNPLAQSLAPCLERGLSLDACHQPRRAAFVRNGHHAWRCVPVGRFLRIGSAEGSDPDRRPSGREWIAASCLTRRTNEPPTPVPTTKPNVLSRPRTCPSICRRTTISLWRAMRRPRCSWALSVFTFHFPVPAHPDHLGKTTRFILIGFHRANRKRRMGLSRIHTHHRHAQPT